MPEPDASPRGSPVKLLAVLAVYVTVVASALLVVAELTLRTSYAERLYREINRHPPHPLLQLLPGSQVDHVNAQGFRGDPIALEKPAATVRIFTIGGSTTLGVANPYTESYPLLLQSLLRERHPGVAIEVENAGSSWYTTAHDLVAYEIEVRQYRPDVVIFFEAINDITRSFSPPWWATGEFKPDYSHYLGPYVRMTGPQVQFMNPRSSWLIWNAVQRWLHDDPDPYANRDSDNVARVAARLTAIDRPDLRSLPSFRQYYAALIHAVQSDHTTVLTASQPFLYHSDMSADERRRLFFGPLLCADRGTYPSPEALRDAMDQFNATARDLAASARVPYLDFEAAVPKTLQFFSDDVHLRKPANAILAKIAADAIDAAGLIAAHGPQSSAYFEPRRYRAGGRHGRHDR